MISFVVFFSQYTLFVKTMYEFDIICVAFIIKKYKQINKICVQIMHHKLKMLKIS